MIDKIVDGFFAAVLWVLDVSIIVTNRFSGKETH